jgi:hypothetical protein
VQSGDDLGVRRVEQRLLGETDLLRMRGVGWPIVAVGATEVALRTRSTGLAQRVLKELAPWRGHGLHVQGLAYLGSVDLWLGVAAAAASRSDTAEAMLRGAIRLEEKRGAALWVDRARKRLDDLG